MSWQPATDPVCTSARGGCVELVIEPRARALPNLTVRRTLPVRERRRVGPFVFLDHMGPVTLAPGSGVDVPPHPHIGLATVTYLFAGELEHRDSLGTALTIQPGDVNWMSAGRGIVHSERTPPGARPGGPRIHGLQSWVALPREHEESEPTFEHRDARELPSVPTEGGVLVVIAGDAYGARSPVRVLSPLFYVHAELEAGAILALPDEHDERAAEIVSGDIECDGQPVPEGSLVVFRPGRAALRATSAARVVLLGGAPLDGERHIYWNFVSSARERIEQAKRDWRERRFPLVPGDEREFVPLP